MSVSPHSAHPLHHHPAASARLYAAVVLAVALASVSLLFQWARFPHDQLALLRTSVPRLRGTQGGCLGGVSWATPTDSWTPQQLRLDHKRWVHDWVLRKVPSLVKVPRRQLTLELGLGAILEMVPGDFVETGVAAGGTAILMAKVLEEFDEGGSRVLWAADSFDGLPPPTQVAPRPLETVHSPVLPTSAPGSAMPRVLVVRSMRPRHSIHYAHAQCRACSLLHFASHHARRSCIHAQPRCNTGQGAPKAALGCCWCRRMRRGG